MRTWASAVGIGLIEELHCLLPILGDTHEACDLGALQCPFNEKDVGLVVFDNQDMTSGLCFRSLSPGL